MQMEKGHTGWMQKYLCFRVCVCVCVVARERVSAIKKMYARTCMLWRFCVFYRD